MDIKGTLSVVGRIIQWLAVPMILPLALAIADGDDILPFLITMGVTFTAGLLLRRLDPKPDIGIREGFVMVALSWLAVSIIGALPYIIAGKGSVADPVNAFFESMSGFTTTGSTVMANISIEFHSRAIMMWRQLTQWLGGMGIVVLALAVLPELSVGGSQLLKNEAPGFELQKLTPRIMHTARALWGIYLIITLLQIIVLYTIHLAGAAPGMDLFNSVAHAFTTMPTGGFSPEARSIEAFTPAVQWAMIPFLIAAGTNFALFWHLFRREPSHMFRDEEFRKYLLLILIFSLAISLLLFVGPLFNNLGNGAKLEASIRHGLFQTASIMTTTGYASMDFNAWGVTSQYLLFLAMLIGGCAGSTAGAIKVVRWTIVGKLLKRELFFTLHPNAVRPLRLGNRVLKQKTVRSIALFILLYLVILLLGVVVVLAIGTNNGHELTFFEGLMAVASTFGNVGPGIGIIGPMENYLAFPAVTRIILSLLMWLGRLEILPVLLLFSRAYWKR